MRLLTKATGWCGLAWCSFNAGAFAGAAFGWWPAPTIYDGVMAIVFMAAGQNSARLLTD